MARAAAKPVKATGAERPLTCFAYLNQSYALVRFIRSPPIRVFGATASPLALAKKKMSRKLEICWALP